MHRGTAPNRVPFLFSGLPVLGPVGERDELLTNLGRVESELERHLFGYAHEGRAGIDQCVYVQLRLAEQVGDFHVCACQNPWSHFPFA